MTKLIEDMATVAIADYTAAGQFSTQIGRDKDIESIYMWFGMGAVTIANNNTEIGSPFWGVTDITFSYDDKSITIPGRLLPALNYYFYPNDPPFEDSDCWWDLAAAAYTRWLAGCRIPVHIPANPGHFIQVTVRTSGEATWSETVANTAIAASTLFFTPKFGSFDEALEMSYNHNAAVAAETSIYPTKKANRLVGLIAAPYAAVNYTADATGSAIFTFPANTYETDWLTTVQVDVGGETIVRTAAPNTWRFAWVDHIYCCTNGLIPDLSYMNNAYIFDLGMVSDGNIVYRINANTVELFTLSVYSHVEASDHATVQPSTNVQSQPGGTRAGPPTGQTPVKPTLSSGRTGGTLGRQRRY